MTAFLEVRVFPLGVRNNGFSRSDQNTILNKVISIIMLEILIGERLQIKKDPHPTTSKWIYLFPFLAHTYQVITKLLSRLDNSFESWPTLFSSHQAGTGKSSKWSRLASFDSSSLACTWDIGEKKKTFNCAMSFLVISIAMKRGRGCLTWRCFQPPFFQRYCLFWSWPECNTY